MSDRAVIALAIAVWIGALHPIALPWSVPLALTVLALVARRPLLFGAAVTVLAAAVSWSAWAGLSPPRAGPVSGIAVLVGDPENVHGAVRVDVRVADRRAEAWGRGEAASTLRTMLAGEQVAVSGRWRPVPARARRWLSVRHIAARLDVEHARAVDGGSIAARLANDVRRTLGRGAADLPGDRRALLLGVVLGDDREQSDELVDDFERSGLQHLTAVSGQNVAFVLALAAPLLRRFGLRWRWVVTLVILGFFGLLTRWEPSVLRAGAMAALACTTATMGRPTSRLRVLALAVAGLVLVDPLLVHAVGFQLSVGATIGIALLAGRLSRRLPEVLAVTIAAQVGVAPVALPVFGGLPLASLPANLLAVPVAAPLTVWGLTGGVVAGVVDPAVAGWLHLPTRFMTWWLSAVARWAASLPLGQVRTTHAVLVGLAVGVWSLGCRRWSWRWDRTASTSPPGRS